MIPGHRARVRARHTPSPKRGALDFIGPESDAALDALNLALTSAGLTPKPRPTGHGATDLGQVACDAAAIAAQLGEPVSAVLDTSARAFVEAKGARCRVAWWAEDVAGYYDAGKGRAAKRSAGSPLISSNAEHDLDDDANPFE